MSSFISISFRGRWVISIPWGFVIVISSLRYVDTQLFVKYTTIPHSLSRIHSQNLLVNPENQQLKLCDFGSAKALVRGEPNVSYICSRYYRAPELIFGSTDYSTAIDIWSQGKYIWAQFVCLILLRDNEELTLHFVIRRLRRGRTAAGTTFISRGFGCRSVGRDYQGPLLYYLESPFNIFEHIDLSKTYNAYTIILIAMNAGPRNTHQRRNKRNELQLYRIQIPSDQGMSMAQSIQIKNTRRCDGLYRLHIGICPRTTN